MAVGQRARNFKLISDENVTRVTMLNGSTALEEGDMVTIAGGVLVEVADSNTVGAVGICAQDIAASVYGTVYTGGKYTGTADTGVNFALGDKVYNSSATKLDAGTASDIAVGKVVDVDPASAGTVTFLLWSVLNQDITAHA
ncbi:MAG: DUF2190 family protein [Dehalococcoidia bacterium]|jgi:predicted RecA/RadA family phage recombinase|nr:DUF2190 family protein [Dehalococcoidia bacterium]